MTNVDPVMEPTFTKMLPCPGVRFLKMIPYSVAHSLTEKYMSTPPPGAKLWVLGNTDKFSILNFGFHVAILTHVITHACP